MSITIRLNGEERPIAPGTTVAGLLQELVPSSSSRGFGVAVAVNMAVVPRSEQPTRELAAGDRVDVLHAVGGG